jgi:hypothetical protein
LALIIKLLLANEVIIIMTDEANKNNKNEVSNLGKEMRSPRLAGQLQQWHKLNIFFIVAVALLFCYKQIKPAIGLF